MQWTEAADDVGFEAIFSWRRHRYRFCSATDIRERNFFFMSRCYFVLVFFALLACTESAAADYLLRLETAELRELPNGNQKTDPKTCETFEILVNTGQAFYGSTLSGTNKVLLKGRFEEANDGSHRVQVHYQKKLASGESVPVGSGQRLPISNAIELNTAMIPVTLGKTVEFDAQISRSKKIRAILSIKNFDSSRFSD